MKKKFLLLVVFISGFLFAHAQTPLKPKHLLPNGEPDRPFTFFVKHGFSFYTDAATRIPFAGRPAYFFGGGTRIEDDDKTSPVFFELEGLYHHVNGTDSTNNALRDMRVNLNFYFVLVNNATQSFRWNAGTGAGWNSINNQFTDKKSSQMGFNFATQVEMLLKHKRFNLFANYHVLPFRKAGIEQYNFNTLSAGMGFYFR